jgi:hypothetical protein
MAVESGNEASSDDDVLFGRLQRVLCASRDAIVVNGERSAERARERAEAIAQVERRVIIALLAELNEIMDLMIMRQEEIRQVLERFERQRAAASAYGRVGLLASNVRRGGSK